MAKAQVLISQRLGIQAGSRLKTTDTIVEKLVREKTKLSKMQDIAGLRIVQKLTLKEQDELADRISGLFPDAPIEIDDRRKVPKHGYRAVHVIVTIDECPVEIQVRTELQNLWAQIFEKLGDLWGRRIRYGEPPNDPNVDIGGVTRDQLVQGIKAVADSIVRIESALDTLSKEERIWEFRPEFEEADESFEMGREMYDEARDQVRQREMELRSILQNILETLKRSGE